MQKRFVRVAVVLLIVIGAVVVGRTLLHRPAEVRSFRLSNGMQIEVVPRDCGPTAHLTLLFSVGTNQDPPGQSGLLQVVAQLLSASADSSVRTGMDATVITIAVPRDQMLTKLDDLARQWLTPALTEATVEAARTRVLADIVKRSGSDATQAARTDAAEAVLPSAGNGRRGGIASEVEHLRVADIQMFWKEHLTAGNARLVLVGDVDPDKDQARITEVFGKLLAGSAAPARPPREMTVAGTLVMGDAPAAVAIAVRAPPLKDPLFAPFLVLAGRLIGGGSPGWTASYDPVLEPELLYVTGSLKAGEPAEPGAARIRNEMTAVVGRPLTPADVAATKERFRAFLDRAAAPTDCGELSFVLARRAQLGFDPASVAQSIDNVTPPQLTQAAEFFAPNRIAAVIAGGTVR